MIMAVLTGMTTAAITIRLLQEQIAPAAAAPLHHHPEAAALL